MGRPIVIYGKSGSGKSRDYAAIEKAMTLAVQNGIRTIFVDDCGYLMAGKYLDQCANSEKKGNAVFAFYNAIAHDFWDFVQFIKKLPKDVNVYLAMHEEKAEDGEIRVGCVGKQLAEKTRIWERESSPETTGWSTQQTDASLCISTRR